MNNKLLFVLVLTVFLILSITKSHAIDNSWLIKENYVIWEINKTQGLDLTNKVIISNFLGQNITTTHRPYLRLNSTFKNCIYKDNIQNTTQIMRTKVVNDLIEHYMESKELNVISRSTFWYEIKCHTDDLPIKLENNTFGGRWKLQIYSDVMLFLDVSKILVKIPKSNYGNFVDIHFLDVTPPLDQTYEESDYLVLIWNIPTSKDYLGIKGLYGVEIIYEYKPSWSYLFTFILGLFAGFLLSNLGNMRNYIIKKFKSRK